VKRSWTSFSFTVGSGAGAGDGGVVAQEAIKITQIEASARRFLI
jgi:hypothetical protein